LILKFFLIGNADKNKEEQQLLLKAVINPSSMTVPLLDIVGAEDDLVLASLSSAPLNNN
jgi:hypothetical protein